MAKANNKTQLTGKNPKDFLSLNENSKQRADSLKLLKIFELATGEKPKMWGAAIVGFGSKKLKYASGRELDWMQTGFSPRKGKITLYITGYKKFTDLLLKLGKYSAAGGCLYVKDLAEVNVSVLTQIIKKSLNN